jgi:Big-like domain-containing protein
MFKAVAVAAALALTLSACGGGGSGSSQRNQAPTAFDLTLAVPEDGVADGAVTATDPDSAALSMAVVTQPQKGTVVLFHGTPLSFKYFPAANQNGADSFTFRVSDGQASSNTATVSISIAPLNDAPVVRPSIDQDEDSTFDDEVVTEVDGESMTVEATAQPSHGSLVLSPTTPGRLRYQPAANYFGADQFEIRATDASNTTTVQVVAVTVRPVNDAPQAVADSGRTTQGRAIRIDVLGNDSDVEGDALTVSVASNPGTGTATVNADRSIQYVPPPQFVGTTSFSYRVQDSGGASTDATLDVAVGLNYVSVFSTQQVVPGPIEIYAADGARTVRVNAPLRAGETIGDFKAATNAPVVVYALDTSSRSFLKRVNLSEPGVAVDLLPEQTSGHVSEILLSADGSKVVFRLEQVWSYIDVAVPDVVVDLGTKSSLVLLDPSGDRFFYADIRFSPALQPSAMYEVETATGTPRLLTAIYNPPDQVREPIALSADGERLYFSAAPGGMFGFYAADLLNPPATATLYETPPVNYFLDAATPDGASILISALVSPRVDILQVRPAAPGSTTNLTQGTPSGPIYDHFMSDDSARFYYLRADSGGRFSLLYEVDPNSPTVSTRIGHVPTTALGIAGFRLAHDRGRIVYMTMDFVPLGGGSFGSGSTDLFLLDLTTHSFSSSLRHFNGTVRFGPYAPDNSFVTFLASDELGASENVLYALNVLDPTQIIPLNGSGVGSLPQLTPSPDR